MNININPTALPLPYGDLHTGGGRFTSPYAGLQIGAVLEPWLEANEVPYYEADRNYYNLPGRQMESYDQDNTCSEVHRELHCDSHPLVTLAVVQAAKAVVNKRLGVLLSWEDITPIAEAIAAGATTSVRVKSGQYAWVVDGHYAYHRDVEMPADQIDRLRADVRRTVSPGW